MQDRENLLRRRRLLEQLRSAGTWNNASQPPTSGPLSQQANPSGERQGAPMGAPSERIIGRVACVDGVTRDVYEDAVGRQWVNQLGLRVYGLWLTPRQLCDIAEWMPAQGKQSPHPPADVRVTAVPPATGTTLIPPTAGPAAAGQHSPTGAIPLTQILAAHRGQQTLAGNSGTPQQSRLWLAAATLFAVAFVVVYALLTSEGTPPREPARPSYVPAPARPLDVAVSQRGPQWSPGTGSVANPWAGPASDKAPSRSASLPADAAPARAPPTGFPLERSAPPTAQGASPGRYYGPDTGSSAGGYYDRYYDPSYRPPVGEHWVNGYYRRDGTYVRGHWQTNPDDSFFNNYSTRGNVNPHTGQPGYKRPPSWAGGSSRRR
jgi:hypothetical protein